MKKLFIVVGASLVALSCGAAVSCTSAGGNLYDVAKSLVNSSSFILTAKSTISSSLGSLSFDKGWTTEQVLSKDACSYTLTSNDASELHFVNFGGYLNLEEGVMKFIYDVDNVFVPLHIIDKGKTVTTSELVDQYLFRNVILPERMKGQENYVFNIDEAADLNLLSYLTASSYWNFSTIKDDFVASKSSMYVTKGTTNAITVSLNFGDIGKIIINIDDINSDKIQVDNADDFIKEGGQALPLSDELLYISDVLMKKNYIIQDNMSDEKNKDTFVYNSKYYYSDFYNEEATYPVSDGMTTQYYKYTDFAYLPVYGVEGLGNNVYEIPMKNGEIDKTKGFDPDDFSTWGQFGYWKNDVIKTEEDLDLYFNLTIYNSELTDAPYISGIDAIYYPEYFYDKAIIAENIPEGYLLDDYSLLSLFNSKASSAFTELVFCPELIEDDDVNSKVGFGMIAADGNGGYVEYSHFGDDSLTKIASLEALVSSL